MKHDIYSTEGLYKIVEKTDLSPTISKHVIYAPLIAAKAKAGHFVILRSREGGERIPVTQENKAGAESRQIEVMLEEGVDLIVLARYMQVLSGDFVARFPGRIINVHHSFLPAFSGAKPYHAAHQRGVKLIGATSHYVTEVLDDGPIIEQDVVRVSHRDSVAGMIRQGRDVERVVLSRAVRWHLEHRILAYSNKTVIFD